MPTIVVKRRKNGQIITLSFVFMFLLIWILIGFNTGSADIEYYRQLFVRVNSGITYHAVETGFWLLIKFSASIGMDYNLFLKIYSFVGLLLISSTILRYTRRPSIVFVVYLFYPFLLDVAQIRHFMACALFIFAIRFLEEFNKKNVICYCLFIVIAMSQQLIAFSFLLFLLCYIKDTKKATKLAIIISVLMIGGYRIVLSSKIVANIIGTRDATIDYSGGISLSQLIMYTLFYLTLVFLCILIQKKKELYTDSLNVQELIAETNTNALYKVCVYAIVFIPFLMMDFQFTRLFRACLIPIYIYYSQNVNLVPRKNRLIIKAVFAIMIFLVSIKLFGPGSGYYDTLTYPIFFENGLFNSILR